MSRTNVGSSSDFLHSLSWQGGERRKTENCVTARAAPRAAAEDQPGF